MEMLLRLFGFPLTMIACSLAVVAAQPAEQRIALDIGQCVIARNALAAENEQLKTRMATLEKRLADTDKKPE